MANSREKWIGILTFGFFIMLFALFFVMIPDYWDKIMAFFGSFELKEIGAIPIFPTPTGRHPEIYQAVTQFCLIFGLFQIFILVLRLFIKSPLTKISETGSNIVTWLGASYVFNILLTEGTGWWVNSIGGLIVVLGLSLIVRSIIIILFRPRNI